MKNKLLIALPACVAALILLAFLLLFKGGDMLTLPQRIEVDRLLSVNPFFDEATGEQIGFVHVATANNSPSTKKNSFLWFLNKYESPASYIELDVAFNKDKMPCLADSYEEANDNSVPLERILLHLNEQKDSDTGLVINLSEYSYLESFSAAICQMNMQRRTVVTGVNEKSLISVKKYLKEIPVLCDYDSDTESSLKELKELGADGIICSSDELSKSIVSKAKELDLRIWVRCDNKFYGTVKALSYCVDGVVSTEPEVACIIRDSWGENIIDDVKGIKESYNIK